MTAEIPTDTQGKLNTVELATELTIAWLGNQNNRVVAEEVPTFLRTMHSTLLELATAEPARVAVEEPAGAEEFVPAVSVRKSLGSKDHIISMIDGKPYKTLRRHLSTHGLTDKEYRARYNLRDDYPMVAENYSLARRTMAKKIGLGRKPAAPPPEPEAATAPAKRTRRKAAQPV